METTSSVSSKAFFVLRRVIGWIETRQTPAYNAIWGAVLVVSAVAWALGAWLLPALGVNPSAHLHFFPESGGLSPEPLEQQRYLLALLAALAVGPVALLLARLRWLDRALAFAPAAGLVGVLVAATLSLSRDHRLLTRWLPLETTVGAICIVIVAASALNLSVGPLRGVVRWIDGALRHRVGDAFALLVAFLLAAGVASVCLYTDSTATLSPVQTWAHMPYTFEDVYAVTLGRTPLVDYTPQYSTLLSWLAAPVLLLHEPSIGVFTALMATTTTIAVVCLYLALRMITGGGARALLLYVPTVAVGFVPALLIPGWHTHTIAAYFAAMPLRYSGPLVLLAVTIFAVGRPESRRRVLAVGAFAAGTILMNPEFGVFAAAAAGLSILLANREPGPFRRSDVLGQLRDLVLGGVAVLVLFALLTLVRSGHLPSFMELVYFNRQFAAAGFAMAPIDHLLGLHALIWATCAAAAIAGVGITLFNGVREGVEGRRSAAFLIYAGVFGFGAFAYFVGRSLPDVLGSVFLGWALALCALAWESARRLQSGGVTARAVAPAAVLMLAGAVAIGVGGINKVGYIFHQPARIRAGLHGPQVLRSADALHATEQCVRPGTNVMLFAALPDRVAHDAHVHNWLPFNDPLSLITQEQLDHTFDEMKQHHVTVVLDQRSVPEVGQQLPQHGYRKVASIPNPSYDAASVANQVLGFAPNTNVYARTDAVGTVTCHTHVPAKPARKKPA